MQRISSSATRQQLLEHGLSVVMEKGLRGLTVRGLCQQMGANPGTFVYHFGNRERFATEVLEHWYAPLLQQVQAGFEQGGAPIARLEAMLRQLLGYLSINGKMIAQMALDAAAGEAAAITFMKGLAPRHPRLMLQCIVEAQQSNALTRAAPEHQLMFLMSALGVPMVAQQLLGGNDVLPDMMRHALATFAIDPQYIEQRLQWALRGLSPLEHA
jgi:AcrR family transcriptional regulator